MSTQTPLTLWQPTRRGLLRAGALAGAGTLIPGSAASLAEAACGIADPGLHARDLDGAGEHNAFGVWPRLARIVLCGKTPVVTLPEHRAVAELDPRTLHPHLAYGLPGTPTDLAAISSQRIAVLGSAWDSPTVTVIDIARRRFVARIHAGEAPRAIAVHPGGHQAIVVGGGDAGTATLIDLTSHRVVRQHRVGRMPVGVAWAPGGREAWITLQGDAELVAIDPKARRIHGRIHLNFKPGELAVAPHGRLAAVAAGGQRGASLAFIDLRRGRRRRTVQVGHYPGELRFTRDGRHVVAVLMRSNELVRVGAGGHVWRTHTLPGPCSLALHGRQALVAGQNYVAVRRCHIR